MEGNYYFRLNKVDGVYLTYNNLFIADLAEKRPRKLAEEFSELFDNEWMDAFNELQLKEEHDPYLLNILKVFIYRMTNLYVNIDENIRNILS